MPLAAGFVGILPAMTLLDPEELHGRPSHLTIGHQVAWSFALVFFGVFLAVPLRRQLIVVEQLKFPSGTATAAAIYALNGSARGSPPTPLTHEDEPTPRLNHSEGQHSSAPPSDHTPTIAMRATGPLYPPPSLGHQCSPFALPTTGPHNPSSQVPIHPLRPPSPDTHTIAGPETLRIAGWSLVAAAAFTSLTFFVPVLGAMPVLGLAGGAAGGATAWGWTLSLSPSGLGQGAIMGFHTCASMMAGAVAGWGVLGPLAEALHWCAGGPMSMDGGRTYILWVSLAILLADAAVGLLFTVGSMAAASPTLRTLLRKIMRTSRASYEVIDKRDAIGGPDKYSPTRASAKCVAVPLSSLEEACNALESTNSTVSALDDSRNASASFSPSAAASDKASVAESTALLHVVPQVAMPIAASTAITSPLGPSMETDVPLWVWAAGLGASSAAAAIILPALLGLLWWEPLVAVAISIPVAVVAVRALGQTDLNPVSGVGKFAQ